MPVKKVWANGVVAYTRLPTLYPRHAPALPAQATIILIRPELESINANQEVRVGAYLFSDTASACIVSNGIGLNCIEQESRPGSVYEMLIHGTDTDLGFDVDPLGWKVVLTPMVPNLTSKVVPATFKDLINAIHALYCNGNAN